MISTKTLAAVRQTFAQTVFTHKVQEVAAERKQKYASCFKLVHLLLVFLVLGLLGLQAAHQDGQVFLYLGIAVSVAEVAFLIADQAFDFASSVALHKASALRYLSLRDRYVLLIADNMDGSIDRSETRDRRDRFAAEYASICEQAPQTKGCDYNDAQKRLNKAGVVEGEQFTWSDAEINRFLPAELRLGGQ